MSNEEVRRYLGIDSRLKEKAIYRKKFRRQKSEIFGVKKWIKVYTDLTDTTKPKRSKSDPCHEAIKILLEEIQINRYLVEEIYFGLTVFSSTSSIEVMLQRYFKIDVPTAIIRCYTSTDLDISQLSFFENMLEHKILSEKKKTPIQEIQCIDVNLVVLELSKDWKDVSVVGLSQMDRDLLYVLKQKTFTMTKHKPLQDFIFVLHTVGLEYTLNTVSKEISEILNEDHRDIFKLVFDSEDTRIEERIEASLNQRLKTWMEYQIKYSKLSEQQTKMMQNEIDNRKYMLLLHQIKTVALRHESVIGFGCVSKELCVYLLHNDESEKRQVRKFLEEYTGKPPYGYELVIENKTRNLKMYAKLEQGGKIHCYQKPEQGAMTTITRHGSVGMFLRDGTDTYFTTCGHVIRENDVSYLSTDNSKLGLCILMFQSGLEVGKRKDPWMDFSLVKMSPERPITCQFGLRTMLNTFTNGRIFRGNVCNIDQKMVYKWGASEPNLRIGKCLGVDEYNQMFFLIVDNEKFAEEGDSGSIVCVGDDQHIAEAVFVFVGAVDGEDVDVSAKRHIYRFYVYKIQDALKKMVKERKTILTPCLEPCQIQIFPTE